MGHSLCVSVDVVVNIPVIYQKYITYYFEGLPDRCSTFINICPLFIIPFEAGLSLDFDDDIVGFLQLDTHEKID